MIYILLILLACCTMRPMEPIEEPSAPHIEAMPPMQIVPTDDIENQMIRARAGTISSEESQFEDKMNELIEIFSDVQKIEDEQYIDAALQVFSRDRHETYQNVSPYLCNRLRASYNEIKELTEARKRSSLKKLMKQLIADSINDAFVKIHSKQEEEERHYQENAKKSRMLLIGVIVTGVASTLTAFLAAYFGHSC